MKMDFQNTEDTLRNLSNVVNTESAYLDDLVDSFVSEVCSDLDKYVTYVQGMLDANEQTPITDKELDDIIMTIPTLLYYIGDKQESLGIREDLAKLNETTKYHECILNSDGAVAIRQSIAKSNTHEESLISIVYQRTTKKIKSKCDYAMELHQSCKKVLSRRIAELELSRSAVNKINS